MVLCLIVGCRNRTGKRRPNTEKVRFFRVPRVIVNHGEYTKELTTERRRRWISAISRDDLTDSVLVNDRVCSQHFVSGAAAKDWDRFNVDWVPSLRLGHSKQQLKDHEEAAARSQRAIERRKRRLEIIVKEIEQKMRRLHEPEETADGIFFEAEALNYADELGRHPESNKEYEKETTTRGDHETMNAETQTPESVKTQDAETQTTEFEYLFKETVMQPFTEEYFANHDDRVRFYTGFPGFEALKTTFVFISPFITRRSKTLSLFQEFIMASMKRRLNVPLQDLAYRFGVSIPTVSRTLSSWFKVMDVKLSPIIRWTEKEEL